MGQISERRRAQADAAKNRIVKKTSKVDEKKAPQGAPEPKLDRPTSKVDKKIERPIAKKSDSKIEATKIGDSKQGMAAAKISKITESKSKLERPKRMIPSAPRPIPPARGFRTLVVGVLLVGVVGSAAGYVAKQVFQGKPKPALAQLAPARSIAWFETEKPRATYDAWQKTASYQNFRDSETGAKVDEGWKELVSMSEKGDIKFFKDLGLPLNERTATLLLGQDLGFGFVTREADNEAPAIVVMSEIDVVGIAQDLALQGDFAKTWEKISNALGAKDGEAYKGFPIKEIKSGKDTAYLAFLRPVVVVSDQKWAVQQVIDVKSGEQKSLADGAAFTKEINSLESARSGYAYVDMAFVRSPAKVASAIHGIGKAMGGNELLESFQASTLDVLAQDLKPIDGFAAAVVIPEGDLYSSRLAFSRDAENLFADTKDVDVRRLVPPTTLLYGEARGLWDICASIPSSSTWKAIEKTEAVAWLGRVVHNPSQYQDLLKNGQVAPKHDATFETRVTWMAIVAALRELLDNDVALAADVQADKSNPEEAIDTIAFVRARPLARIAADIFSGYAAQKNGKPFDVQEQIGSDVLRGSQPVFAVVKHGDRQIFGVSYDKTVGVYWTQIGSRLVSANKVSALEAVIDRAANPANAKPSFDAALTKLPEGYAVFGFVDMHRYQEASRKLMPQGSENLQKWAESQDTGAAAWAAYVSKDLSSFTFRGYQSWAEKADPNLKGMFKSPSGEPAVWKEIPAESILSASMNIDPNALYAWSLAACKAFLGEKGTQDILDAIKEQLGGDIQEKVVSALGASHGLALVAQDRQVPEGIPAEAAAQIVAVPAGVLAIEIKNPEIEKTVVALIQKALDKKNAAAEEHQKELEKQFGSPMGPAKKIQLVDKKLDGLLESNVSVHRLVSPDDEGLKGLIGNGYGPCFAVSGKWLLVASSEPALRRTIDAPKGKNLAGEKELARLLGDSKRDFASFSQLSFGPIIDQIDRNVDTIVKNATPPPAELGKAPEYPEFPQNLEGEEAQKKLAEFDKAQKAFSEENRAYQKKVADWREKNAPANAAALRKILLSLKVLGGGAGGSYVGNEGVESWSVWRLDLAAVEAAQVH